MNISFENNNNINKKIEQRVSRTSPFSSQILERWRLTKEQSTKMTYHVTLKTAGSGLSFKVGDSLGVFGQNDPILVDSFLDAVRASGEELIVDPKSKESLTLRAFLTGRANIGRTNAGHLRLLNPSHELLLPEASDRLRTFLQEHDPLDLLRHQATRVVPLQEFCEQFSPLLPRFYSIASSQMHAPEQVDLTVALSSYMHRGEQRYGVASHFLCNLAQERATSIPIYVQPTSHFTLPNNPKTPVIMIGPGTGVAPFRGFMQERVACGAQKNWLFFGERNRATDFYYEEFWLGLHGQGVLHLDLAFSRDQADKIYVQHKLLERQKDLWAWLQEGASVYVCGDAENMARAVEEAWLEIFTRQGGMSGEDAKQALRTLKKEKRYLADVY